MTLRSIADEWKSFSEFVLSKDAPDVQISEMKIAFYAGYGVSVLHLKEIGEPHISEENGVLHLKAVSEECDDFCDKILKDWERRN